MLGALDAWRVRRQIRLELAGVEALPAAAAGVVAGAGLAALRAARVPPVLDQDLNRAAVTSRSMSAKLRGKEMPRILT